MRALGLVGVVAVAGGIGAAAAQRPTSPTRLTRPGALHLIEVTEGRARCERWTVVPGAAGQGRLVRDLVHGGEVGTASIDYRLAADAIELTGRGWTLAGREFGTTCELRLPVSDEGDALAVGGARWFADPAGCAAALAARARVATAFDACDAGAVVTAAERAAMKRAFEQRLRDGGALYYEQAGRCFAVNVTPARSSRPDVVTGRIWRERVTRRVRSVSSTTYLLVPARDELAVLGSSTRSDDGTSYGIGCGRRAHLQYARDHVYVERLLFLTRVACDDALRAERTRAAWSPTNGPAASEHTETTDAAEGDAPGETRPDVDAREAPAPGEPADDDFGGLGVGC